MIRARRPLFSVVILSVLILQLAVPVAAQDTTETESEETDSAVAHIEKLRTEIKHHLEDAHALDTDAETAPSRDARALRRKAIEIRLSGAGVLIELTDRVVELESGEHDVAAVRQELEEVLPKVITSLNARFVSEKSTRRALQEELDTAAFEGSEPSQELRRRARASDELVGRFLAMEAGMIAALEKLGKTAEAAKDRLRTDVAARARVLWSRIEQSAVDLADAIARSNAQPDDAALAAAESTTLKNLQANTRELEHVIGIMGKLEMDATRYKQVVIEYTGEITSDVFDRRVAGQLLARWMKRAKEALVERGPGVLFKTVVFALILSFFWGLARFARRLAERAVAAPHLRFSQLLKRMVVSVSYGLVILLGLLIAFSQLGIEVGPMLAGLGIAGFIVGFALQETLGNFASGVMILLYRPFDVGDLIECTGGVFGKVSHMSLVSTTVLTLDNQTLIVPNGKIWGDVITNVTAQRVRRVDLLVGISYGDDIAQAEKILEAILEEHPKVLNEPEAVVKVHELGDSSVNLIVRPWVARDDYWDVYWDVTREVKLRFDREGISIPFPQRDIHVASGEPKAAATTPFAVSSSNPGAASAPDANE